MLVSQVSVVRPEAADVAKDISSGPESVPFHAFLGDSSKEILRGLSRRNVDVDGCAWKEHTYYHMSSATTIGLPPLTPSPFTPFEH